MDYIDGRTTNAVKYICVFHREDSENCKTYKNLPTGYHKYKGYMVELAFVLSKLASITP